MSMSPHEAWPSVFSKWSKATGGKKLGDFLNYLLVECHVIPGRVMTEEEWDELCELTGTTPDEAESLLMSTSWP